VSYNNKIELCTKNYEQIKAGPTEGRPSMEDPRTTVNCEPIQVIMGKDGIEILYTYIGMIYRWGASMVGIIAVLIIVASGIQISGSAGDSEAITAAKKRMFQAIIGMAILFLSAIILYTINPTFFVK
jgi:hypothetical protein